MAERIWENFASLDRPVPLQPGRNGLIIQRHPHDIAADIDMPIDGEFLQESTRGGAR